METISDCMEVNSHIVKKLERHRKNADYYTEKQQVFIIGCKGIPAAYGGFETFVEKLTQHQQNDGIRYHVARIGKDSERYEYNGAKCFNVKVPEIGAARAVYYDMAALWHCIQYCRKRPSIKSPVFYVLACRIGPFIWFFKRQIERLGGVLYVNPDGHEWKRAKWSAPIKKYWKISERYMVKHADLLICDSKCIENYIRNDYAQYAPRTTFIAYGADTMPSSMPDVDARLDGWYSKMGVTSGSYYLIVGRLVPENNYETMISEFMKSNTRRSLVIITTANNELMEELENKLGYLSDTRIRFAGTVYDGDFLKKIRENAYGYLHGHEVGGTNPSLLESLSSTRLNLLLDVNFNKEVAGNTAYYWTKEKGSLSALLDRCDAMSQPEIDQLGRKARERIRDAYSWEYITKRYEDIFLNVKTEPYMTGQIVDYRALPRNVSESVVETYRGKM